MEWFEKIRERREQLNMSQGELGKRVGLSQAAINKIEQGLVTKSRAMPLFAEILSIPLAELDPDLARSVSGAARDIANDPRILSRAVGIGGDVPVYAAVEGGSGEMIVEKEPIDYVPRPEPLNGIKDGYLVQITGDSMIPEFWPGERAIVSPTAPRAMHEPYIFYTNNPADDRALIKRLNRTSTDDWHVEQWNPAKSFSLPRNEWPVCHRVVGKYTRR